MRLHLRTWGSGPRTAVLVHGFSDDARTWWRVGPAVASLGFTVVAPDLRGHGCSPRTSTYAWQDFVSDLVDTLAPEPDVLVGHSLGGLVVGLAAPLLRPRRTVFVDPAWLLAPQPVSLPSTLPLVPDDLPAAARAWAPEEIAVDLASNALLDPRVAPALSAALSGAAGVQPPPAPEPGSVVLVPELDPLVPPSAHATLDALGYRVRTQRGVRHVMHRDDFAGFMALLRPELIPGGLAA